MIEIKLNTKNKKYITTVCIPKADRLPEIIQWGDRYFIKRHHDMYLEGRRVIGVE